MTIINKCVIFLQKSSFELLVAQVLLEQSPDLGLEEYQLRRLKWEKNSDKLCFTKFKKEEMGNGKWEMGNGKWEMGNLMAVRGTNYRNVCVIKWHSHNGKFQ